MKTIKAGDYTNKPIIRNDHPFEVFNKMTDDERNLWNIQTEEFLKDKDRNTASIDLMAMEIDFDILHTLFKLTYKNETT